MKTSKKLSQFTKFAASKLSAKQQTTITGGIVDRKKKEAIPPDQQRLS
ncbi:hypothetical protein ACE193_20705 [Bernardetia sp. OM2101]